MPKNPDQAIGASIPSSQMRGDLAENKFEQYSAHTGPQFYALNIATVQAVDYAKMEVTLRTGSGEEIARVPVPLTFPGAGHRHFLGSLPETGDVCVVGWGMQESGRTRHPWILAWILPSLAAAYDWLPTQPYSPDESGTTPSLKFQMEGVLERHRPKLRHMEPGNVVGSSSQGSDLVLNESVLLANRRGNELILRDQDQALVVRTLQQFHAGAGFRVYGGMVQRDATFLPTQMFSDGTDWASSRQVDGSKNPLPSDELDSSEYPAGYLTPAGVFQRAADGSEEVGLLLAASMNPYEFLKNGLFITEDGYAAARVRSDGIYGGKPIYRVSTTGSNAAVDLAAETFTEYRVEVSHTADGTLPVSEQTDGFDANRLPSSLPLDADPLGNSIDTPFLEWVLGSVIGNDPYTPEGKNLYGIPLRPIIFAQDVRSPSLATGVGAPLEEHAAMLLRLRPPVGTNKTPTFISMTKDGRLMASLAGPGTSWSTEIGVSSGMRLGVGVAPGGESISADLDGALVIRSRRGRNADNIGMSFQTDQGAIRLFAGGTTQTGGAIARQVGANNQPALILESGTNTLLKAVGTLTLTANQVNLENTSGVRLSGSTGLDLQSGAGISVSSNTYVQSSTGKSTFNYSGPKDGLPTNGPLRETSFTGSPATGFVGGTADKYEMLYGNRVEQIAVGMHSTTVLVGNATYRVGAGILSLESGVASIKVTPASITGISAALAFTATAGAAIIQATTNVSLMGATVMLSAPAISLTSPVGTHSLFAGGILTDGVIDGITGRPFKLSGTIGVPGIQVF